MQLLRMLLVGALAGFLSGLLGVGGGVVLVPALVAFLAMAQRQAHATSLAALLPISLAGGVGYVIQGAYDPWVAVSLAVGALPGVLIGSKLLTKLSDRRLRLLFTIVMVAAAARLMLPLPEGQEATDLPGYAYALLVGAGVVVGVLSSLLGVGGGVIIVPLLIVGLAVDPIIAKGTSLLVIIPIAIMASWRNRKNGLGDLKSAAIVGLAGAAASVGGVQVSMIMDARVAGLVFAVFLLIIVAQILVRELRSRR